MSGAEWFEVAKWFANTLAVPGVIFIWKTMNRISTVEAKMDMLIKFHGLENVVKADDVKPAAPIQPALHQSGD